MKPKDLVDQLLSEDVDFDRLVDRVETRAQDHMGDVITDETTEDEAREEAWTLCIDAANEILRYENRPLAIKAASEAAHRMGYTPKGYRPVKRKAAKPVWPPRTSSDPVPQEPERVVKPTGVVHGHYRPSFLYPQG